MVHGYAPFVMAKNVHLFGAMALRNRMAIRLGHNYGDSRAYFVMEYWSGFVGFHTTEDLSLA